MAIALSFGTVASFFLVWLLIPALNIWDDLRRVLGLLPPQPDPLPGGEREN